MALQPYDFQQWCIDHLKEVDDVLIGDDMGLGKTIEAILLDKERRLAQDRIYPEGNGLNWSRKTLVVTFATVMGSWQDHFADWQPGLRVYVIDRKNRPAFVRALEEDYDVYIMHWDVIRLMVDDLKKVNWLHIIADECQRMKNRKAQLTVAMKKIRTRCKTAMSGTWADNAVEDGWSVLNWLYPSVFRSYWAFYNYHVIFKAHNAGPGLCNACLQAGEVKQHRNSFRETLGVHDAEGLHKQMEPFYVRRTKEEVLDQLPEKTYTKIEVDLDPRQRRVYDEMARTMLAWVGEHEDEPMAAPVVIAQLVRLQQFAVAYGQVETYRKRWPKEVIEQWTERYGKKPPDPYDDAKRLRLTDPSSKIDAIMDLLEQYPNKQFVVFGQSKQAINLLGERLHAKGISYGLLTGDTEQARRNTLVSEFQRGLVRVFCGTVQAGGVGITLTAADTVIFLDRAWSPSANRQAEDRLHRIGQKNAVQVIDLVARDTIDLGRIQRIELKWEWLKELLGDKRGKDKK